MRLDFTLLFLGILMFTGMASANHYTFPDETVTYGDDIQVSIGCDSTEGECADRYADKYRLNVCGETAVTRRGNLGATTPTDEYVFNFNVPNDATCEQGLNENAFEFVPEPNNRDSSTQHVGTGGTLTVNPDSMDAHNGKVLRVAMDPDDTPTELWNFYLTDEQGTFTDSYTGNTLNERIKIRKKNDGFGASDGVYSLGDNDLKSSVPLILSKDSSQGLDTVLRNDGWWTTGGCFETCKMVTERFSTSAKEVIPPPLASSSTPIHSQSSYWPDGEVLFGDNIQTGSGPQWYICREGSTMSSIGGQTYQVVDADWNSTNKMRMKCIYDTDSTGDKENFRWEQVTECEDGLDNDNDGEIDKSNSYSTVQADTNCLSGKTESATTSCSVSPKVFKNATTGELYAQYKSGGDCVQTDYADWSYVASDGTPGTPQQYTCQPSDTGPDCDSISDYDGYSTYDTNLNTYVGDMPVVSYGAHPQYFKQLANARGVDIREGEDGVSTDFVETNTGWTTQTQSLYTAERKYDAELLQGDTPNPSSCDECQSYNWWNDRDLTNLGGYQESSTDNHIDAWNVYNAGANISGEIDSGFGSPFQGGFAGNCPDSVSRGWADSTDDSDLSNQLWECVGETFDPDGSPITSSTDPVIEVPGVTASVLLPDTDIQQGSREIGLVLMPYLHQDSRPEYLPSELNTYHELMSGTTHQGDDIESMDVECWAGSSSDQPDDVQASDSGFYEENVPVSSNEPYGVTGEVQADDVSNYACAWQYNTAQRSDPIIGSGVVELHKNTDQGEEYNGFWNSLTSEHNGLKEDMDASELQNIVS